MAALNILFKRFSIHIIIFILLITVSNAGAGDEQITGKSVFKFTAGLISAFTIHEASHALVAGVCNIDLDWETGNYNQPLAFTEYGTSDSKGLALYSSGIISQVIGSEVILQSDKINKNDAFIRGMMAWNVLNPIMYALDYWFIRRSNKEAGSFHQGDIEGIEHYSGESTAHGFAVSMAALAAYQGYRFIKTQPWAPDWIKEKSHKLYLEPLSSDGISLKIEFKF